VIEGDLGTAPGEQLDRGEPDARGCTRHQCGLASKKSESFARACPGETVAAGAADVSDASR
jgi:hypothetical protein